MNGQSKKIHMVDAFQHIGWMVNIPSREGEAVERRIMAVANVGSRLLLALDAVECTVAPNVSVELCNARAKDEQLNNAMRGLRPLDIKRSAVAAKELPLHVGDYAFVETGGSKGPHLILSAQIVDGAVRLTVSVDELIAPIDQNIIVRDAAPQPLAA